jgi:predicted DNA binding protein/PAS domain-containing protein
MLGAGALHVLLLTVAAATTAVLARYALRHRDQPGAIPFSAAMVSMSIWSGCYAVSLTQTGASRLLWERLQWLGVPLVAGFLFLFILEYTGYESVLTPLTTVLVFVIPVSTVVLVQTNPLHHLVWTEHEEVVASGVVTLVQEYGPWFWVLLLYNYVLITVGGVLLVRLVLVSEYLYIDQAVLLVLGIAAPFVGNVLSVLGTVPIPGLDVTPYAFTVTGIAFGNALFRYRLFDILPATRQLGKQAALAGLDDGVVIVGEEADIIYLNDAAADIFGTDPEALFGDRLQAHLDTDDLALDSEDAFAELTLDQRTYEVTTAPITDQQDRTIGYTILLHDVTSRVWRERTLRRQRDELAKRERTLRQQRDELARLERLNSVIRNVNATLVSATSREEIARTVCETLVTTDTCDGAWFGLGPHPATKIVGMAVSDDGPRQLDSAESLPDSVTLSVAEDEASNPTAAETTRPASRMDGGAGATIPLVYGRTVYGVLALEPGAAREFTEREHEVLSEMGETIGHAIHAVEQERLLVSDVAVELEFQSTDPAALFVALSEAVGPCTLDGLVPGGREMLLAYVTVDDATTDDVMAFVSDHDGVTEVESVDDDGDSATVEVTLTGGSLCCPLVEFGANVRSAEATDGRCRLVAEVSPDTSVRTVVERVTDAFPATDLRSKRELTPPGMDDELLTDGTLEGLTERQRATLEAAYRAGYFEWPRDSTAEEVAESMDVSSATVHQHLRKAENQIFSRFFPRK